MPASFTIPSIFTAVDKFTGPLKNMGRSIESFASKAETRLARADRFVSKLTPSLGEAGKQLFSFAKTAVIAAAIVSGVSFTTNAIKDYEVAVQSFRTIVSSLNNNEFLEYQKKIREVALDTKKSSIDTARAFEAIAGLNAEFAKTPDAIAEVSKASITLSKASRDELGKSASNLVGILNQYELQANQASRVINVLAAGQAAGASTITQTADAFTVFGAVAKNANLTLEESTGLIEVLASKQIMGAEAGTALRGSLLALQKAGLGYKSGLFNTRDALVEFNQKLTKLTTAKQKDAFFEKVFGVINRTTGTILAQNIELYDKFTDAVTGTSEATKAADINSNSLVNRLEELKNKWVTLTTTSDNSNAALEKTKQTIVLITDNMETLIAATVAITVGYVALKAIIIATRIALIAYNVVLGITGALSSTASVAIGGNAVALGAYKAALWVATSAQWAWNAALTANPIGLIIVGIAALIGIITAMIIKWNEWGAALSFVLGPLGLVISLIQSFRRNWEMITQAFSNGGIIAGFKAIGKVILDAILMPFQQIMKLIANITGAKWASNLEKATAITRKVIGVNTTTDENGEEIKTNPTPALNPEAQRQMALRETIMTQRQNVAIDINDQTGRASVRSDNDMIPIKLTSTMGF